MGLITDMTLQLQDCIVADTGSHVANPDSLCRDAQSTENPFSTDFYHLFQSTDKKMIYNGRIYGFFVTRFGYNAPTPLHSRHWLFSTDKQMIFGRIYGLFLTRFRYYPLHPIALSRLAVFRARRVKIELFRLLPQIS